MKFKKVKLIGEGGHISEEKSVKEKASTNCIGPHRTCYINHQPNYFNN